MEVIIILENAKPIIVKKRTIRKAIISLITISSNLIRAEVGGYPLKKSNNLIQLKNINKLWNTFKTIKNELSILLVKICNKSNILDIFPNTIIKISKQFQKESVYLLKPSKLNSLISEERIIDNIRIKLIIFKTIEVIL